MAEAKLSKLENVPFFGRHSRQVNKRKLPRSFSNDREPKYREPPRAPKHFSYGDKVCVNGTNYYIHHFEAGEQIRIVNEMTLLNKEPDVYTVADNQFEMIANERVKCMPFRVGDVVICQSSRVKHDRKCPQRSGAILGTFIGGDPSHCPYLHIQCLHCAARISKYHEDVRFVSETTEQLIHIRCSNSSPCEYCLLKLVFQFARKRKLSFRKISLCMEALFNFEVRHRYLEKQGLASHGIRVIPEDRSYAIGRYPKINGLKVGRYLRLAFLCHRAAYYYANNTLQMDYHRFFPFAENDKVDHSMFEYCQGFLDCSLSYLTEPVQWQELQRKMFLKNYDMESYYRKAYELKPAEKLKWKDIQSFKEDLPAIFIVDLQEQTRGSGRKEHRSEPRFFEVRKTAKGVTVFVEGEAKRFVRVGQMIAFREPVHRSQSFVSDTDSGSNGITPEYNVFATGMVTRRSSNYFEVFCPGITLRKGMEIVHTNEFVANNIRNMAVADNFDDASDAFQQFLFFDDKSFKPTSDHTTHDSHVLECYERGDDVIAFTGPPKAGKSDCISKLLQRELKKLNRILLVSVTNTGVARIAELLLEKTTPRFPEFAIATFQISHLYENGVIVDERVLHYCVSERKEFIVNVLQIRNKFLDFVNGDYDDPDEIEDFLKNQLQELHEIRKRWIPFAEVGITNLGRILMEDLLESLIGITFHFSTDTSLSMAEMSHQLEEALAMILPVDPKEHNGHRQADLIMANLLVESNCVLTLVGALFWRQNFNPETLIIYQADRFSDGRLSHIVGNSINRIFVTGNEPAEDNDCSIISRMLSNGSNCVQYLQALPEECPESPV